MSFQAWVISLTTTSPRLTFGMGLGLMNLERSGREKLHGTLIAARNHIKRLVLAADFDAMAEILHHAKQSSRIITPCTKPLATTWASNSLIALGLSFRTFREGL